MNSDWMAIGVGFLFIAVMSAPIWLAPLTERWTQDGGRTTPCLWEEEA